MFSYMVASRKRVPVQHFAEPCSALRARPQIAANVRSLARSDRFIYSESNLTRADCPSG
jgi:hypothetical protein